jgi:tellurium resistance protein TerD
MRECVYFMSVTLSKGQKVELTKGNAGLEKLTIGLGWDTNKFDGAKFDLDASVVLLGADGKVTSDKDLVFFGNLAHESGSVTHSGDNLTGDGDGDDEQVEIDLSKVPANIEKISFIVGIYDAEARKQNFGMVSNSFIRIVDKANGTELMRYDLGEDFSTETVLTVGEIYRNNGEWKFSAVGSGIKEGFATLCTSLGINLN